MLDRVKTVFLQDYHLLISKPLQLFCILNFVWCNTLLLSCCAISFWAKHKAKCSQSNRTFKALTRQYNQ